MNDKGQADDIDAGQVYPVLVPIPAPGPYSYRGPAGLAPGTVVQVPLGPRSVSAVIWDDPETESPGDVAADKLRPIEHVFDCPPLKPALRRFVDWLADYYLSPPGMVVRMVLRAPGAFDPPPPLAGLIYQGGEVARVTPARERVLALARDGAAWTKSGLAHAAGVTPSVVDGLVKLGVMAPVEIPAGPAVGLPDPDHGRPELSPAQEEAARSLRDMVTTGTFRTALLEGVTGAGKTETYFEAVAETLRQGRQVLVLLPEIALTETFLDRFEARFGARPAEWHSALSPKKREASWRQAATGQVRIVAGARSALFLPFADLGLIVVDEEHDPAYKQEDRVTYHARDMAVVRGSLGGFPVILSSATPSVETKVNAQAGKYLHIRLAARHGDAMLPDIRVIDMRRTPPPRGGFIAPPLREAVAQAIEGGGQALLFLNRRGYAPLTLCRVCGHRFRCEHCSAWLVEHRFRGQLQCHHCGHTEPVPQACPNCGALDHLAACGPGIERLAEEVAGLFPQARTLLLSSDLIGGTSRLRLELEAITKGEADIVIGTQLVAKGHNFPLLSCVGVIDADLGLANGDPRAAERTFQLLSQVTGRAGRDGRASTGWLQSYQPDHPVIQAIAAGDGDAFYAREIENRRMSGLPPYGRLAAVIVSAASRGDAESHAQAMRRCAPENFDIRVLGPAEAPLALIRGRHRFRLLVHAGDAARLHDWLRVWLQRCPKERGSVRVQIDIDPQSFL